MEIIRLGSRTLQKANGEGQYPDCAIRMAFWQDENSCYVH